MTEQTYLYGFVARVLYRIDVVYLENSAEVGHHVC